MKVIIIPKLDKYQHYHDRNIVWIKVYCDILRDFKFQQLTNEERWFWIGLIILACQSDNKVPLDYHYLATNLLKVVQFRGRVVSKWQSSVSKMVKLGLISIKSASIEQIKKERIDKKDKKIFLVGTGNV
jgi:hypothetical protein